MIRRGALLVGSLLGPHQDRALEGFGRVLRLGGRLGLLDAFGWYFQHDPRWRWQEEVQRSFGALREGDQGDNSATALATPVARAGFTAVELIEDTYDLVFHDEDDWWRWSWSQGTRSLFEAVAPTRLDELKQRLFSGLQNCREQDGLIHGKMRASLLRAQNPARGRPIRCVTPLPSFSRVNEQC